MSRALAGCMPRPATCPTARACGFLTWAGISVQPCAGAHLFDAQAAEPERFYFVHSYCVHADEPTIVAARCHYGEHFVAAFQAGTC